MKPMLKRCPVCNRTYPDITTAYCLSDGSLLSPPFSPLLDPNATQQFSPPLALINQTGGLPSNLAHTRPTWRSSKLLMSAVMTVAVIIGILTVTHFQTGAKDVPSASSLVTSQEGAKQLVITDPSDGASVKDTATIQGTTPYPKEHHYVIVTPVNKVSWVWPATVATDGSLSGSAQFGEGEVGKGETFEVRILATKSTLSKGVLKEEPKDAKNSKTITVIRTD
jgi:hypothetical protein